MKDLTTGKPVKLIFFFALPMLLGNVFQQFYNTVDSIVVGHFVGKTALGAVGASFPIFFLLISLVIGITMGSGIVLSQYFGARDYVTVKRAIETTYIFLFWAALAITAAGFFSAGWLLHLINTPAEIFPQARLYLQILFLGSIPLFGYNSISGVMRGLGDSKTPLYLLIIATLINVILDLFFVLVLHWGVAGVSLATVIAQAISFGAGIRVLNRRENSLLHFHVRSMRFDPVIFRQILRMGLPTTVQQSLVGLGFLAITGIVNSFGTNVIAAYAAAVRIDSLAAMPAMNFSMAVSTFVGQNIGAGKIDRVRQGFYATLAMGSGLSVATSILIVLLRKPLMHIFTRDTEVIRLGADYLLIVGAGYIFFSAMFISAGVIRGAGATFFSMLVTLVSLWLVRIPLSWFLSRQIGVNGIWWGMPLAWIAGFLGAWFYYLSGRWKTKSVVRKQEEVPIVPVET
jgi:putative MATE family efflux protein